MVLMIKIDAKIELAGATDLQSALETIEQAMDTLKGEGDATGHAILVAAKKDDPLQFNW